MLTASSHAGRAAGGLPLPVAAGLVVAAAAVALLPLPYNLAAVIGIATVALTLLRPTWGLYLVLLSVPVQDLGAPRLGDTAITATKVMVPLALMAWAALRLGRGGARLAPAALTFPYGLYVVALIASTMTAVSQPVAITEALRWVQAFGIFLMTLDLIRTRRELAGLAVVLLLGGLSQALLGLVQSLLGAGPASFAIAAGFSRAFGTFGMPNSYAGYLEMTFPLALALGVWRTGQALAHRSTKEAILQLLLIWLMTGAAALLLLAGIIASYSRGAWLGTAVGTAAMIALAGRRSFAAGATAALLLGSLLWLGGDMVLPAGVAERLESIGDSLGYRDVRRMVITSENFAVAERLGMWQAGIDMFEAAPIYGVGAGNFNVVYDQYRVPQFLYSRGHAHNYYIHVAAETGIIGLVAYALVLVGAWVDVVRGLRGVSAGWPRALVLGAAGVLAAVVTHNLGENLHVLNMNLHLFAVLAIPALALRLNQSVAAQP